MVSGVIHAFVSEAFIRRHLGGSRFASVVKATLLGIPLPICSCGVIPLAAGLRKDGASRAATMSFLVSTPTTGADSIFVTYAFLGLAFAIIRPFAALLAGVLIGAVMLAIRDGEKTAKSFPICQAKHSIPLVDRIAELFNYGFRVLPGDIGKTVLLGVCVGGVISAAVPEDISRNILSNPLVAYPLMLAVAVPVYVCATGSVPIVAAMMAKGLAPGAAMVFLIAGPATNTITLAFVAKSLGKKALVAYLWAITMVALGVGIATDILISPSNAQSAALSGGKLPLWLRLPSAVVFLLLVAVSLKRKQKGIEGMRHSLRVPAVSCKECRLTIKSALRRVPGVDQVVVCVDERKVFVDGDVARETLVRKIRDAGFEVESAAEA